MKNGLKKCKVFVISLALIFSGLNCILAQSLDEILETQPETSQPPVEMPAEPAPDAVEKQPAATAADNSVDAIRQRIVELAEAKVGTVHNKAGEDGHKIGWQNLKEFYESAYQLQDLATQRPNWLKDIKAIGKKVNDWCGIFCVWAWQKAGLPVHWNTRVVGCKYRGQKSMLAPGDIVIIKKSVNPYNHHCLVKSVDGNRVETIDGNQGQNSIQTKSRKIDDIEIFYSVAEAAGAPIKPNPAAGSGSSGTGVNNAASKPQSKPSTSPATSSQGSTGTNGTKPAKPATASTATNAPAGDQPAANSDTKLSEKEIDQLITQILTLIRVTLGQFF